MKTFRCIGEDRKGIFFTYEEKAKDMITFLQEVKEIFPDVYIQMVIEI